MTSRKVLEVRSFSRFSTHDDPFGNVRHLIQRYLELDGARFNYCSENYYISQKERQIC